MHFLTEENQATGFVDPEGPTEEELDELVRFQRLVLWGVVKSR